MVITPKWFPGVGPSLFHEHLPAMSEYDWEENSLSFSYTCTHKGEKEKENPKQTFSSFLLLVVESWVMHLSLFVLKKVN